MQGLNTEIYRNHMKPSLITREREIKATIRHYYISTGMAKILKTDHSKHWWECEAMRTLISVDGKNGIIILENNLAINYNVKQTSTRWPSHSTQRKLIYPREIKTYDHIKTCTQIFSFICNSQNLKTIQMSINK